MRDLSRDRFFLFGYMKNMILYGYVLIMLGSASTVLSACVTTQAEKWFSLVLALLGFVVGTLIIFMEVREMKRDYKRAKESLEQIKREL